MLVVVNNVQLYINAAVVLVTVYSVGSLGVAVSENTFVMIVF